MVRRLVTILPVLAAVLCGVLNTDLPAQELSQPEETFEYLWNTYDRNYALFGPKRIDWNALYRIYRPQVTAQTTDDELFDIMANLLGHLNDNHVRLRSPEREFRSGILGDLMRRARSGNLRADFARGEVFDFSLGLVKETYLSGRYQQRVREVFTYGWLSDSIGYFHFKGFGSLEESTEAIDEIVAEFRDARGIIIDVRANGGGDDRVGKAIADRFADRKRLYMTTQARNGPEHDDFDAPKYWYVEPNGPIQFTGPLVLITHRLSVSAAENFALAMRVLPHATLVGDMTSGVFADVYGDQLPNGWQFGVSYKLFLDPNGFCWEGIGVPVDIRQTNTTEDIAEGRDRILELAMALIVRGKPAPKGASSSLRDVRESLVEVIQQEYDANGLDAALEAYDHAKRTDPAGYYVDQDELIEAGTALLSGGQPADAVRLFELGTKEFPGSYVIYERLGDAYFALGEADRGRASYDRAIEVNRRSYPWEKRAYESERQVSAGKMLLARALGLAAEDAALTAILADFGRDPDRFHVDENEMNGLGYRFLRDGRIEAAIAVFKVNVEQFPQSWNVYDSLGEAYMVAGETDLAIEYYEKSIEINPNNQNGREMLARLKQ